MAKRRRNEISVELFPFLSILACVIGVLALAIAGTVVGEMDSSTVKAIERAKQYQELQKTAESRKEKVKKLRQIVARTEKAEKLEKKVKAARKRIEKLEKQKEEVSERRKKLRRETDQIEASLEQLKRQIARLEKNLERTRQEIRRVEKELAKMNRPPEPADIVVKPGGSGEVDADFLRRVVFAECRKNGVTLYKDPSGEKTERYPSNGIRRNLELIERLDKIAVNKRWLVLLVRPDGARTARRVEQLANRRGAYNGKLPVPGDGHLDLSRFRRLLKERS